MSNKKTVLAFVFGSALILSMAYADGGGEPSSPYEVKETARFYRSDTFDENLKKHRYLSFVVLKGFNLTGCWTVTPGFMDGYSCGQDEFPSLHGTFEKNGVKRALEIDLSGGTINLEKNPNYKTKEGRGKADISSVLWKFNSDDEVLSHGEFFVKGKEVGYFGRKTMGSSKKEKPEYYKVVFRSDPPCSLAGYFREKSEDGKTYIDPKEWLFESVFDDIMRSMRCELVAKSYVDKWGRKFIKMQEAKKKADGIKSKDD